jgi:hypothetical protein
MKRMIFFSLIALIAISFLSGCSSIDRKAFCASATTSGSALGVMNPFLLPCIVNSAVDVGSKLVKSDDVEPVNADESKEN